VSHVTDSILTSVKKVLGLAEDYTAFDKDVVLFSNTAFSTLSELGIGPIDGFMIEDSGPTWDTFLNDDKTMNDVKTYVYLRVRILFDNASLTSYMIEAMDKQIKEFEWRLNVKREATAWTDPTSG
jgi:hypothetical protein